MSDSEKLSTILDLCIQIDQTAADLYTSLSASAGNDALKDFWHKMTVEGLSHVEYWQKLKTLASYEELPEAFDKPDQVIKELKERAGQIHELSKQWEKDKTVSSAFVIAYRLESYKLHPALRTLFHYFRPITEGKLPEDKEVDETNIAAFVSALRKYGESTPELELVGETLQRLWDQNKILSQQSLIDPLSNLLNRRGFFMMAQQMAHLSRRNRIPMAVLLVEIDSFKKINELHGPQKGDDIIKLVGEKLKSTLRQSDLVARYGGNEYIILLPNTTEEGGVAVAEKLRTAILNARPMGVMITVSIGVAEGTMKDDIDQEFPMLIRYAEGNLIIAKSNGKNQVVF
ncbi:MAG: diguanylate cyclase [Anaerolineales bacterium]